MEQKTTPKKKEEVTVPSDIYRMHRIQSYGFWVLIIFTLGFGSGLFYSAIQNKTNTRKIIATGSFYYEDKGKENIYDITKRNIPNSEILSTSQPQSGSDKPDTKTKK